jgi:hypothetical protein
MPYRSGVAPSRVVVDTNALYPHLAMRGPFRLLLRAAARGDFVLVVPEIVVQETLKQFRLHYETEAAKHAGVIRSLRRFPIAGLPNGDLPEPDVAVVEYEAELRRRLHDVGARIVGPPDVGHEEVLERAIARRRPFKESGEGYQDTLIWLTVLEEIGQIDVEDLTPGMIALVSGDNAAFWEGARETAGLGADLRADLEDKGVDPDVVTLFRSLQDLVGEAVEQESPKELEEMRAFFEDDSVQDVLVRVLTDELQGWQWPVDNVLSVESEHSRLDGGYVDTVAVEAAWELEDDEIFVRLVGGGGGEVEFEIDAAEAKELSRDQRASINFWGEGMASGRLAVDLEVDVEVLLKRPDELTEIEITGVSVQEH